MFKLSGCLLDLAGGYDLPWESRPRGDQGGV